MTINVEAQLPETYVSVPAGLGPADDRAWRRSLRPGRVYALEELLDYDDPARLERQRSALAADGDLLSEAERQSIEWLIVALQETAKGSQPADIEAATKALATGTEAFAAMRMNRGIQQALAGHNIEDI